MKSLCTLFLASAALLAQGGLNPAKLGAPPTDTWPTYNGDYSGRRYSPLSKINQSNINSLIAGVGLPRQRHARRRQRLQRRPHLHRPRCRSTACSTSPCPTTSGPWTRAPGARSGTTCGRRTAASTSAIAASRVYGNWLYFETPDCNLVSLNLKDGKERWHKPICDLDQYYFGSIAPLVVKNHVITGVSGDDLDVPGYIESHDPETGDAAMALVHASRRRGRPRAETWPSDEAMKHGGGMTWLPGTYDPELNLIYFGTGNPQPVIAGQGPRGRQPVHRVASSRSIPTPARCSGISSPRRTTRTIGMPRRRPC